jgi:hypothetical protein
VRLGEHETRAQRDRIAAALAADVTIDLTEIDIPHLLVEHRAACAELRLLRATNQRLNLELDQLLAEHIDTVRQLDELRSQR